MINKKKVSFDVEMFREILQFCPNIPGQEFEDLPLEHDILSFIRDLGHSRDITYLFDVSVDYLHQPWRAFATIINKCLSGKETRMDKIQNKESKKTNKMSYPIYTKIIIDYFMSKDQSISRRNKMFWHTARDDTMFTSMRCISRHEYTQVYGTILQKELTNQEMLESKAYKTYHAFASGEKTPKPKYVQKKADSNTSPKQKPVQATKGTRIKTKSKVAKSDKKKQLAKMPISKGLDVLSKVALTKVEQLKLATKRSKTQFHSSHASGSDEGTGTIPWVPDVPIYKFEIDKESWGDNEDEDDENDSDDISDEGDDENDETDSDRTESNRIKIPILNQSTTKYYKEEEKIDDKETMDDDEDDEVTKELYEDVNVNLGNEDTEMTNDDQGASEQQNVSQESGFEQVEEDAHLLNLENPSPSDNEIASLMETSTHHVMAVPEITFAINKAIQAHNLDRRQEAQDEKNDQIGLVDTSMRTIIREEVTTQLPQILPQAVSDFATPVIEKNVTESLEAAVLARSSSQPKSTYEAAASLSEFELTKILLDKMEESKSHLRADYKKKLYDALVESYNIDRGVIGFNDRVTNLEKDLSEIKQVDQYAQALSSIPAIVNRYMDNKLGEAINKAIQAYNLDCRQEAQDEKNAYIELVNTSMRNLIKEEKNVTESVEAAVLTRSSSQPTSTYEAATSLSEFELSRILIDKMEKNKSRDDKDKDRDPSAGSDRGTKRRKSSKDVVSSRDSRSKEKKSSSTSKDASQSQHKSSGKFSHAKEPSHTVEDLGMQQDQEFVMGNNDEQPADKEVSKANWFKKPERPPTPDSDWNKRQQVDFRPPQTWISQVARAKEPRTSFDELMDTSFDFSAFVLNRLNIEDLT
ncbi:hypothetical protein Tco_0003763 [Tanacetum coccineum]